MAEEVRRVWGVLLAMAVTGSAMVLGLALLFKLNATPPPDPLGALILPCALLLPIVLPLLLRQIDWGGDFRLFNPARRRLERKWRKDNAERQKQEQARRTRLFADPATRRYAEAMERGEYWSDKAIAYDRDPSMLATDPVLQPIEAAMRHAGITMRHDYENVVSARCVIDADALYAQFPPGEDYRFTDQYQFDRGYDPDEALIVATNGRGYIHVVHPRDGRDLPIFPRSEATNR